MANNAVPRRIDSMTSRTAEWTCVSRAASSFEIDAHYHSDDYLAALLVPEYLRTLLQLRAGRAVFRRFLAKRGMYEYVIARTKYIDAAFRQALADDFDQIVLFGAGFDTRALRIPAESSRTRVFELDVPRTQNAKIERYRQRNLAVPRTLKLIAMDFDRESIREKLEQFGFREQDRTLFILEGVLMYLLPTSVDALFRTLQSLSSVGSRLVFDYVCASVLRGEMTLYGEAGSLEAVKRVGEQWRFGLEPEQVGLFLSKYGFALIDHKDATELERLYFVDSNGLIAGRINATQSLVKAALP